MGINSKGDVANLDIGWSSAIDFNDEADIANIIRAGGGRSNENVDSVRVIERQGASLELDKIFHD